MVEWFRIENDVIPIIVLTKAKIVLRETCIQYVGKIFAYLIK